jgi:hypothetical protein
METFRIALYAQACFYDGIIFSLLTFIFSDDLLGLIEISPCPEWALLLGP